MRNIEIKARIGSLSKSKDDLIDLFKRNAIDISPETHFSIFQRDIFFRSEKGRLKARVINNHSAELIFYVRENSPQSKLSTYWRSPLQDFASMEQILTELHGKLGEVSKAREVYLFKNTRIHLDQVAGLGDFLELEVVLKPEETEEEGHQTVAWFMQQLGINPSDLLSKSYFEMLSEHSNI
ncbi:MAG: class IV adenylate cyclase [Chloroherpetonaceae bacterium]|nr:class IV adenylate cyclase [Chloroherpetonaceae bacterium]